MKLVSIVTVGFAGLAASNKLPSQQANSFLRTRRAARDDPSIFNYREDWENFKDFLEARDDVEEDAVDKLETCVAECRQEDYKLWGGSKFSELKEDFDAGKTDERPFPCGKHDDRLSCCTVVPKSVFEKRFPRDEIDCKGDEDCTGGFTTMFNSCVKPECTPGNFADVSNAKCSPCEAGTFSSKKGSSECAQCPANTFSKQAATSCTDCNAGEHSAAGSSQCTQNSCTCENGSGAVGAACSNHGDAVCASCNAGFHLEGDSCEENQCSCENGVASSGLACANHGAASCESCSGDFILNGNSCEAPECTCENGVEHTDSCFTGNEGCDSCNAGFHKEGNACVVNQCACSNGAASSGVACSSHGADSCASCDAGHHLSGDACEENVCSCSGGTAATGVNCPNHGDSKCVGCGAGFELSGAACSPIGPSENQLRLAGGSSSRGRLEVFYRGAWGTVCNDDFENIDAQVACKQLGFSYGNLITAQQTKRLFGSGTGPIWLDNVACTDANLRNGDQLVQCRRGSKQDVRISRPIGNHNCGHNEDIGVECFNQ